MEPVYSNLSATGQAAMYLFYTEMLGESNYLSATCMQKERTTSVANTRATSKTRKSRKEKGGSQERKVACTTQVENQKCKPQEVTTGAPLVAKPPTEAKRKGNQPDDKALTPVDLLREGSIALLEESYAIAVSYYDKALEAYACDQSKYHLAIESKAVILYALGTAYMSQGIPAHFEWALKQYQIIIEICGQEYILAHYGIGKVYFSQNRFYEARAPFRKILDIVQERGVKEKMWPGTDRVIEESKKINITRLAKTFLSLCLYPPRPFGICRFQHCQQLKTYIYLNDPDFKGFIRLKCSERCAIDYHIGCWKKFRTENLGGLAEKDSIDKNCCTPDCRGYIALILRYNEGFNEGTSFRSDEERFKIIAKSDRKPDKDPCRIYKAARSPVSSVKHLARIEERRERRRQAKLGMKEDRRRTREERLTFIETPLPDEDLEDLSASFIEEDQEEDGVYERGSYPNGSVGTAVLKKGEEADLFPTSSKPKKRGKKHKAKLSDGYFNYRHDEDEYGRNIMVPLQDTDGGSQLSTADSNVSDDYPIEFEAFKQIHVLFQKYGFLHLVQQAAEIDRQLSQTSKEAIDEVGGLRSFLCQFPFYHMDPEDPNFVSLDDTVCPGDMDAVAFDAIIQFYNCGVWGEVSHRRSVWQSNPRTDAAGDGFSSVTSVNSGFDDDLDDEEESVSSDVAPYQGSASKSETFPLTNGGYIQSNTKSNLSNGTVPIPPPPPPVFTAMNLPFTRAPFYSSIKRPLNPSLFPGYPSANSYISTNEGQAKKTPSPPKVATKDPSTMAQIQSSDSVSGESETPLSVRKASVREVGIQVELETEARACLVEQLEINKNLVAQLVAARDSLQKEKSRATAQNNSMKDKLQAQKESLSKEIQSLKEAREQDKREYQYDKKLYEEERTELLKKVEKSRVESMISDLKIQDRMINALKEEARKTKLHTDQVLADNEDTINKMSRCITEQSARGQGSELRLLETMEKLLLTMFAPVKERVKFALGVCAGISESDDRNIKEIRSQWSNFNAAMEMELEGIRDELHHWVSRVNNGETLDHSRLPVIAFPPLTEPPIPVMLVNKTQDACESSNPRSSENSSQNLSGDGLLPLPWQEPNPRPGLLGATPSDVTSLSHVSPPGTKAKDVSTGASVASGVRPKDLPASKKDPGANHKAVSKQVIQEVKSKSVPTASGGAIPKSGASTMVSPKKSWNGELNATVNEASPKKSQNFEVMMQRLLDLFPELFRSDIELFLSEFRKKRPNSKLSGMKTEEIIAGVSELIKASRGKGAKGGNGKVSGKAVDSVTSSKSNESMRYASVAAGACSVKGASGWPSASKPPSKVAPPPKANAWGKQPNDLKAKKTTEKQYGLEEPCVVCLIEMTSGTRKLQCGHTFHQNCIEPWLKEKRTCPTCRKFAILPDDYPKPKKWPSA